MDHDSLFPSTLEIHTLYLLTKLLISAGACCQGVPGNGRFRRPEDVGVVCTSLIFTCTVLHSAVNYPQYNEYGFPPNYPLILNGSPPSDKVRFAFVTRGQSNLTKSASRGAHSPVRGHPRGSKFVPLNSWGRVSY